MEPNESQFALDGRSAKPNIDIRQCMQLAARKHGKTYAAQFRDIFRLSRGDGKLQPPDYYYFGLYDDDRFPFESKRRFLSDRIHLNVIRKCCDVKWWAAADDKFLAYTVLGGAGAPIPETLAIFSTAPRRFGRVRKLSDADQLAGFLASRGDAPVFAKPLEGVGSYGAYLIERCHGGEIELHGGLTMPMDAFVARLDAAQGYMFQDVLRPHPALHPFGDIVSTVRIIVIFDGAAPEILHTIWKVPANGNIADNFWRKDNLLAAVDRESGRVERVVRGVGPWLEEIDAHPDTGADIKGIVLPDWRRMVELCLACAGIFSSIRYQSWDIAMCPDGPVIVEVNTGSAFNLSQLATGEGFLTDRFREFLTKNGYALKTRH